ncbi:MAG TPA: FAD-dependent oxidoreductase, partial [Kofleriaceae bacterium]|nr:FAD-dependent oxidoreductase [Kofleriaceae bacterium]
MPGGPDRAARWSGGRARLGRIFFGYADPMSLARWCALAAGLAAQLACAPREGRRARPAQPVDVLVVGCGIAGLSAAVEAASAGARVLVVDRWSVFGGHAVMSGGGVTMIDTPLQRAAGVVDGPRRAAADFLAWGGDADPGWVRRYAERSRVEVHDWLTAMGVVFERVSQLAGNSVPRYHRTRDRGLGLVIPIYRNAVALGVELAWNQDVVELIVEAGQVRGVRSRDLRTGAGRVWRAGAVVLATGGFQSDLIRVRQNWPAGLPLPPRVLAGSGVNSTGDGLDLARRAGAAVHRLDHQWNYPTGLPDPRARGGERGLNVEVPQSIWVNAAGERFVDEQAGVRVTFPAVLRQPGGSFWAVLDADGAAAIAVSGPEWSDRALVERLILSDPSLVTRAGDLRTLATGAGLPPAALERAVAAHNRSGAGFAIARPPYHAMRLYPLARKSMGGVAVDVAGRVLDRRG